MKDTSTLEQNAFKVLAESVTDYGIFILDKEGYIRSWNEGARRIKGYEASEIIGKHFSIFYTQEDLDSEKPKRELIIATAEGRYEEEGWRLRKDGTPFWASIVITALRDSSGELTGFGKVTKDLTAKKIAEEKLRESEMRYRTLVNNVKDYAIFLIDPNGRIQTWNAGAEILMGYSASEIIGEKFNRFYTKEDLDRFHPENELKIAKQVGKYDEEGWRLRKDGSRFWANIVLTKLEDANGEHIGFTKITRDLTARKLAEESLKESEERFRLMVEGVKDYAIITIDTEGYVTSWNEGARRLKGYELHEIKGKHFGQFYEPEDVAIGKCEYELKEAAATGRFEDEGWRVRKDGTKFWANVVVTPLRDSAGKLRGFSKVTRDITERKRTEDKLRMAHEGLERRVQERTKELQSAIESRDEFLSIASHELRTPLTALKLQQQIFERQLQRTIDPMVAIMRAKEISDMTKRQVAQLGRLIDDMLDVSRISTGRLRLDLNPCDVSDLVAKVVQSFEPQFEDLSIATSITIEPHIEIICDFHRLEQVIANLLSNAIKYGGGTKVTVTARQLSDRVEIVVKDAGPGISKADQARIFKRYERAISASEVSGLGLGLFISEQIVSIHGGTLTVESEPGKGAQFIVLLPMQPPNDQSGISK